MPKPITKETPEQRPKAERPPKQQPKVEPLPKAEGPELVAKQPESFEAAWTEFVALVPRFRKQGDDQLAEQMQFLKDNEVESIRRIQLRKPETTGTGMTQEELILLEKVGLNKLSLAIRSEWAIADNL